MILGVLAAKEYRLNGGGHGLVLFGQGTDNLHGGRKLSLRIENNSEMSVRCVDIEIDVTGSSVALSLRSSGLLSGPSGH